MAEKATHEEFIETVARMAVSRLPKEDREKCKARIVYGTGKAGTRGTTYYGTWQNGEVEPIDLVEICAFGEESLVQVAGTTIHEIAHVLAGPGTGHGKEWKACCARLGLRKAQAAGMRYSLAALEPEIRETVWRFEFADGRPNNGLSGLMALPPGLTVPKLRPCTLGVGTRGGKSRGAGSGSRLRKFTCACGVIVRASRDELRAVCIDCGEQFSRE